MASSRAPATSSGVLRPLDAQVAVEHADALVAVGGEEVREPAVGGGLGLHAGDERLDVAQQVVDLAEHRGVRDPLAPRGHGAHEVARLVDPPRRWPRRRAACSR